ncbi:MAG: hypothetical protein F6K28_34895 [Microcoleus sp. SIO2G3]|nr:hypothetical protein [Microcoleus sp. SIO2G3]
MALPMLKPTVHTQLPERRHADPPGLWSTVVIGSVVIHILLFGILRLLLMGRLQGFLSEAVLIPVDIIPLAPGATAPVSGNQFPINRPARESPTQPVNRQPSSAAVPPQSRTNSREVLTQNSEANRLPVASSSPNIPQNRPSNRPTSPTSPNIPQNQPSNRPTSPTSPNPVPNPSSSTPTEPSSPNPSPNPSPIPTESGSPNPQQGSGFLASPGQFNLTSNQTDVINPSIEGDAFATLASGNRQSFSGEELRSLGINLDQVQVLQVRVWVETTGQTTVTSTQVQQGNLSASAAQQLAKLIVEQWQFNPTRMAGSPVPREYYLSVTITPTQN